MSLVRTARAAASVMAALLVVGACTADDADPGEPAATDATADDEPSEPPPPAGLRVGVVLPDSGAVDANVLAVIAADVRRLDSTSGPEIEEIRPHRPGDAVFVGDLAWALAERHTDLICVLGRGSRSLASELAEVHPDLDICAGPLAVDLQVPASVQVLEVRADELGHVIGVAAASAANGGTVGLVLGSAISPRVGFGDGLAAGLGSTPSIVVEVGPDLDAMAAVEQLLAEGVEVVVVDAVAGATEALERAAQDALVLGPDAAVRGPTLEHSVLTWRVRWDRVLRRAVDQLVGDTSPGPASFGFREEVFMVADGQASTTAGRLVVARAMEGLTLGELDPLEPVPDEATSTPAPPRPSDGTDDPGDPEEADDPDAADEAGDPDAADEAGDPDAADEAGDPEEADAAAGSGRGR